ncbi:maestro heat-like repeat family member 5 isoform X3 [Ornithorhynchus anatinus]|uniref:maestro heat-like repeat family member 5 isoform X3 n=1 Tax=Ornithorhynchus anatinus TaxID=9258 RepID=UPI0019D446DE|nr:maestro heat-like repeat family member 5 isoform X3 [Ornithorhynchus anatinus]
MGRKGSAQKGFLPLARVAPAPEETEVKLEVMSNERCFELVLDELYGVQSHGDLVAWVRNLTSAHLSFLSLKVLIGLRSSNLTRVAHAVRILSILLQVPKALDDQAADLARSVYEQLISSGLQAEKNLLQEALALLGRHHTREIVQVFLEYSRPLNREVLEVLKCVGADASIASLVLWALLRKVFGRPQREESNCTKWERHTLSSIAAVNTLYELLFVVEYSGAVAQLLPQLFLAFIIQIQYVLELGLVGERVLLAVQPTVPSALSPWRTALEALRGLLSKDVCVGCWQSFTSMELQDGWQLFWSLETFQEGVALLARTLVQSRCPMVAELLQTVVSSLLGKDRQGRSVAVGLLAELIWIPALKTVVDPKVVRFILQEGLEDPDPVVRVISLQALTSLPLNPNKERAQVRVAALELLAAVAGGCVKEKKAYLQQELICCLLPVLLHLKDEHPTVGKKARYTFFWLARSIGWSYTEEVGWALSWEESENTAYGAIWKALMESFKDSLPIFLTQALAYTNCPQPDVKFAAVVFLVYTSTIALKSPLFSEEVLEILFQKIHYLEKDPSTKIRRFLRFYKRILAENDGLFF